MVLYTQNLIPNGDFEYVKSITRNSSSRTSQDFNSAIYNWYSPTKASPDIFSKNAILPFLELTDSILPYSGNIMGGIILSGSNHKCRYYREYIQIKLIDTLETGISYSGELWVNSNTQLINLGVLFSTKGIYQDDCTIIKQEPQFIFSDTIVRKEWRKVQFEIIPADRYSYVMIGDFSNTSYNNQYKYCYLDDIKLSKSSEIKEMKKEPISLEEIFTESNVNFDFGNAILKPESYTELDKLSSFLSNNKQLKILIEGHTDSSGSNQFNNTLSIARAKSVMDYITTKKIGADRIEIIGFGSSKPIAGNNTLEGKELNRRVSFKLVADETR